MTAPPPPDAIRRRPDGSIDQDWYLHQARVLRARTIRALLRRLLRRRGLAGSDGGGAGAPG